MTKDKKDTITVVSAIAMLGFGCLLTTIAFFLNPLGEIHDSVLWVLGQCFLYAGSALGIAAYARSSAKQEVDEVFRDYKRSIERREAANSGEEYDYEKDTEDETEA